MCLTVSELPVCFIAAGQPEGRALSNCSSTNRGISLSNTGSGRDVGSVVYGRTVSCDKDCMLLLRSGFMAGDAMRLGEKGGILVHRNEELSTRPKRCCSGVNPEFSVNWPFSGIKTGQKDSKHVT